MRGPGGRAVYHTGARFITMCPARGKCIIAGGGIRNTLDWLIETPARLHPRTKKSRLAHVADH